MATTLTRKPQSSAAVISGDTPLAVSPEDDAPLPLTPEERAFASRQFAKLSRQFPDLRMELTAEGEIIIMAPAHSETGRSNFKLAARLARWIDSGGGGEGFDSSTGFTLPDGTEISPDVSWITHERWNALTKQQKSGFAQICPDFVMELRFGSDRLSTLQKKMHTYIANGARLGWLIDPRLKRVEIYEPGKDTQVLHSPQTITAGPLLPGFTLDLSDILT